MANEKGMQRYYFFSLSLRHKVPCDLFFVTSQPKESDTMHTYGLIGKTLSHSWSKQYFDNKFLAEGLDDCRYLLLEGGDAVSDPSTLAKWLHDVILRERLAGFNVTVPYKQWVLPLLDALTPTASAIGAVNCVTVHWQQDGTYRLTGHNTDAPAFGETLSPLLQSWHRKALILGTGGAAHAVAYAMIERNIKVAFVSRDVAAVTKRYDMFDLSAWIQGLPILSYSEAQQQVNETFLLVNATPVGMYPFTEETPWPASHELTFRHFCYDLIYNPVETRFLQESRQAGAQIHNGLSMLHLQAQLSWECWHCFADECKNNN